MKPSHKNLALLGVGRISMGLSSHDTPLGLHYLTPSQSISSMDHLLALKISSSNACCKIRQTCRAQSAFYSRTPITNQIHQVLLPIALTSSILYLEEKTLLSGAVNFRRIPTNITRSPKRAGQISPLVTYVLLNPGPCSPYSLALEVRESCGA